jgi:hypothetical protein
LSTLSYPNNMNTRESLGTTDYFPGIIDTSMLTYLIQECT